MKYFLVLIFFISSNAFSQCNSGNCTDGYGIYDFGWCVYTGEFKDGKPDGKGKMKYDDYTYEGSFKNGLEDGAGLIIYKDGQKESVFYNSGTRMKKDEKLNSSEWKELEGQSDDCIKGNCNTGFGTVQFPSGNKYVGNFVNHKKEGNGTFYFTNGDVFEGTFKNDLKESGTYTFSNGYTFTGKYLNDDFYNGSFNSPAGASVKMENGKVIEPVAKVSNNESTNKGCNKQVTCPHCYGKGVESKPIEQKLSWNIKDTYTMDRYGNRSSNYDGRSGGNTYSIPNYITCTRCGGKGYICK